MSEYSHEEAARVVGRFVECYNSERGTTYIYQSPDPSFRRDCPSTDYIARAKNGDVLKIQHVQALHLLQHPKAMAPKVSALVRAVTQEAKKNGELRGKEIIIWHVPSSYYRMRALAAAAKAIAATALQVLRNTASSDPAEEILRQQGLINDANGNYIRLEVRSVRNSGSDVRVGGLPIAYIVGEPETRFRVALQEKSAQYGQSLSDHILLVTAEMHDFDDRCLADLRAVAEEEDPPFREVWISSPTERIPIARCVWERRSQWSDCRG